MSLCSGQLVCLCLLSSLLGVKCKQERAGPFCIFHTFRGSYYLKKYCLKNLNNFPKVMGSLHLNLDWAAPKSFLSLILFCGLDEDL